MSKRPPFPSSPRSRPKSPATNGHADLQFPPVNNPTLPLSISRPQSRSESPYGGTSSIYSATGPSRPARSDRRPRQEMQNSPPIPASLRPANGTPRDRISINTSRSEWSLYDRANAYRTSEERVPGTESDGRSTPSVQSPKALVSALAAFQSAGQQRGQRRRNASDATDHTSKSIERPPRNRARPTGNIDSVLNQIRDEWADVIEDDFNPVTLALSLLDESSVGRDLESFRQTKRILENALKGTVDTHYQAFASSLPHHASLLTSLNKAQSEITDARTRLQETRDALGNRRPDLVQLWSRGQAVEEMMRMLDEIEHLKSVPDTLESLISEKRFLQAAILLVRSLKSTNKPDMLEIGAVSDLRSYLVGQETALRDILIEELHSHLYLKTFWCDTRWAQYRPDQNSWPTTDFERDNSSSESSKRPQAGLSLDEKQQKSRLARFLTQLSLRPTNEEPLHISDSMEGLGHNSSQRLSSATTTDVTTKTVRNPESDSFSYIENLLESLTVLGRLVSGLDIVAQRLPVEIFTLVETTIDEVSERLEFNKRMSTSGTMATAWTTGIFIMSNNQQPGTPLETTSLRLAALESSSQEVDHEILRDFFWTLYSKLDAVIQSLRVVFEISNRIGSRRDFKDSSGSKPATLFPLIEIWTPIQTEMGTLLNDYLVDEDRGSATNRNPISLVNEVLRDGKLGRDRAKALFRFNDTDTKVVNKALKRNEDELTRVLKEIVPGLVGGPAEGAVAAPLGSEDRFVEASQHRLLTRPDAFHVSVLFQPTLAFLDRVSDVIPDGKEFTKGSSTLLDEFVLKIYLPQLEEKVSNLFLTAVNGPDAFQESSVLKELSPQPLVKAAVELMALINSLCVMLRTTPFHRENYSRLILSVIIQFYQRCSDHYRNLASQDDLGAVVGDSHLIMPARWAQKSEVSSCLSELFSTPTEDTEKIRSLCKQETRLELGFLSNGSVKKDDLIRTTRNISALSNLYHSLTWFIGQLSGLRMLSEEPPSPSQELNGLTSPLSSAVAAPPLESILLETETLKLPLTRAMALRFDALLKTYEQLGELVLCTIRIDIRCRAIHSLGLLMHEGNFRLDQEAYEPDSSIMDLNAELATCDDCTSATLPTRERRFVFEGLGTLMERVLISNSRQIGFANRFGVQKILRNVLALQQNLKTINDLPQHVDFERARRYWELFFLTPSKLLDKVRDRPEFTFDEYKAMLDLQCGVDTLKGDASGGSDYNMYLIDLHALAIDDWGEGD